MKTCGCGLFLLPENMGVTHMERKVCEQSRLEIKGSKDGPGELVGYASTWGNWDRVKERPVRGAFMPHLANFTRDGFIAIGHDWSALPVASVKDAHEDEYGLLLTAEFHSTPMAQEARTIATERLNRGKSVSLSIGYEVMQDEYVEEGRLLKEVQLFEVSLVNVPANPAALVTGAKGNPLGGMPLHTHFEAVLTANSELTTRAKGLLEHASKEGRVLSGANRTKLSTLLDALAEVRAAIEELLEASEPKAAKGQLMEQIRKSHALRMAHRELLRSINQ